MRATFAKKTDCEQSFIEKYECGCVMLWEGFLVRVDGKMDGGKYKV